MKIYNLIAMITVLLLFAGCASSGIYISPTARNLPASQVVAIAGWSGYRVSESIRSIDGHKVRIGWSSIGVHDKWIISPGEHVVTIGVSNDTMYDIFVTTKWGTRVDPTVIMSFEAGRYYDYQAFLEKARAAELSERSRFTDGQHVVLKADRWILTGHWLNGSERIKGGTPGVIQGYSGNAMWQVSFKGYEDRRLIFMSKSGVAEVMGNALAPAPSQ